MSYLQRWFYLTPFEVNAWVNQYLNSFIGIIIYPCPCNGLIISKQSDQSLNHITIEIDNKLAALSLWQFDDGLRIR